MADQSSGEKTGVRRSKLMDSGSALRCRWGILSCALVARNHWIPAMREVAGAQVQAIASRTLDKAQQWADELGIEQAYGSYEQLLADPDIDAVFIGLPNSMHHQWVLAALEAGKHVLCDKPLAVNWQQAEEMAQAAEKHGKLLMEGFMYQYNRQYELIDQWLTEKRIGDFQMIRIGVSIIFDRPGDFRYDRQLGGGVLLDLGCYCVHVIRTMYQSEPRRVQGMSVYHAGGADWSTSALLEFDAGRMAVFDCSFAYRGGTYMHLIGNEGMISSDSPLGRDSPTNLCLETVGETVDEAVMPVNRYASCIAAFQQQLAEGAVDPSPARDSIANMRVLDAISRSAESSQAVEL